MSEELICGECGGPIVGKPSSRRADMPVHDVCPRDVPNDSPAIPDTEGTSNTAHRPSDDEA